MARKKSLQTSFAAGELSPEVAMRQDTDQYQNGAKSLLNRRMLIGGGHVRRPGSWLEDHLGVDPVITEFIVNQTTQYILVFTDGLMSAYVRDTISGHLSAAGSVAGPWTGTIYKEMDWVQRGNTIFLSHSTMITQVVTRTGSAAWARANFAFSIGPSGRPEQPYLKIAAPAVTLTPSAVVGSITLTASAPVFVSAHVGQYIRYAERAMLITGFTDTTHVTATVIERLPATLQLTVTDSTFFAVSEVIEGGTSGAKGQITAIPDATHINVVLIEKLIAFGSESIIGPNAVTASTAVATIASAAFDDWDEQVFGPVYGYPSCVELHRNRMVFGGHPAAPDYMFASGINNLYNFNVGTGGDADAIIESIGDAGASKILQFCSAEQLLVLTDRGPYYVAEGLNNPFRASSISFLPFGSPWPINATAQVQAFDSGAIMVSGSLIIKARQTGNTTASWDADEVSLLSPHLVDTPDRLAVTSNFAGSPERYAVFRNSDGTAAVLQLVEVQKIRNFTPWATSGDYLSFASISGDLYAAVRRNINGTTTYTLELFDQDITLDAATQYATKPEMDAAVVSRYGTTAVNVVTPDYHLGEWPVTLRTVPSGPFTVGLYYTSTIETLPPVIAGPEGPMAGDFMRIIECYVDVLDSARFTAEGYTLSAYQLVDDVADPPPRKNGPQRFQFMGWEQQPTITITQADPLPLKIRSIRSIVAF
jgi:hypothetical protein